MPSLPHLETVGLTGVGMKTVSSIPLILAASALLFFAAPGTARAQTDCLAAFTAA
jgi:hypothetical protein